MPIVPLVLAIDDHLGKPDESMLTDQMRLELLVSSILDANRTSDKRPPFFDATGDFLPLEFWDDVHCREGDKSVAKIFWQSKAWLNGADKFYFEHLPAELEVLSLVANAIRGTVGFRLLPRTMTGLSLRNNLFSGETPLKDFPESMLNVNIAHNQFVGSLHLEHLPRGVVRFFAGNNLYEGSIRLDALPPVLVHLSLDHCRLTGGLYFDNLPSTLRTLNLSNNQFDAVDVIKKPDWVVV